MSLFDFPRVHFSGHTIIDPATGNNNYHFPLVTFEPISGTAVLPPRIYLENEKTISLLNDEFPDLKPFVQQEENSLYLIIEHINTPEKFKSWNTTPLGLHHADKVFHNLYKVLHTEKDNVPLAGQLPGYWNYYGTLNFGLKNVKVHSIQYLDNNEIINCHSEENTPEVYRDILGSSLHFSDHSGRLDQAVMIDVSPTLSLYSQVFCDQMILRKTGKQIFKGAPGKASLRQMNPARIINDSGITGASGIFYSTIPLEMIEDWKENSLINCFLSDKPKDQKLIGVRVRYDLYHVQEDNNPDYTILGEHSNPASSRILGTFSPWFEGELSTIGEGRLLLPDLTFNEQRKLGAGLAKLDLDKSLLSLDLIGTFPGIINQKENEYELFPLPELKAYYQMAEKDILLARIPFPDLKTFISRGGIFDFTLNEELVKNLSSKPGFLHIDMSDTGLSGQPPLRKSLLKEKTFRIFSEQIGLYAEEGALEEAGFLSNSSLKENFVLRIYQYGQPFKGKIGLQILELDILPYSRGEKMRIHDILNDCKDGDTLHLFENTSGQKFFAFLEEHEIIPADPKHYMLETGAFVNLRVLPSFSHLLNIREQDLNFDLIYTEVLMHYDLIYPASGIITPFNSIYLTRIYNYLKRLMNISNWPHYLYMPSSRDMPEAKVDLLFRWLEKEIREKGK